MAAQKGNLVVVSVQNSGSPTTYTAVASTRSTSLTINKTQVDVTTNSSASMKKLLDGAGITSFSISLSGAFEDTTVERLFLTSAMAVTGTFMNLKLSTGSGDTYIGPFAITSLKRAGTYNGEETYDLSLDSAGAIAFTAGS